MITLALLLLVARPVIIDGVDVTGWATDRLWELSDRYYHQGRYDRSVNILRRIVQLDPADLEASSVAAWLLWSSGDEPAARRWLQEAVDRNPDSADAHWELGFHLFDRIGEVTLALPHLERSIASPEAHLNHFRTLAHAYAYGEQPHRAAALWRRLAREGRGPLAVAERNALLARRQALNSDLQARSGGLLESDDPPDKAFLVESDQRTDGDGDGSAERRELLGRVAGSEERVRLTYSGQKHVHKTRWLWRSMALDLNRDGAFDSAETVTDSDGDGLADVDRPLLELQRQWARTPPALRRFVCPDRFALGVGPDGRPQPLELRVVEGRLTIQAPVLVATDRTTTVLSFLCLDGGDRSLLARIDVPLPAGVYCAHSGDPALGPQPALDEARLPDGPFAIIVQLGVEGLVLAQRPVLGGLAERTAAGWRLAPAPSWLGPGWDQPEAAGRPEED